MILYILFVYKSLVIKSSYNCIIIGISWVTLRAVDSALYSFAPFSIMFITNFAIVFKFMRAKCKSSSTESTNQALAKSATRGTAMVITVSVTFLLLTAPTGVHNALRRMVWSWYHSSRISYFHEFDSVSEPQHQWCIVLCSWIQISRRNLKSNL